MDFNLHFQSFQQRNDAYAQQLRDYESKVMEVSRVIHESRALDVNTQVIFPLGKTAAAIRGENELWLAMVLRNKIMLDLKPAELAAVCGALVSELERTLVPPFASKLIVKKSAF